MPVARADLISIVEAAYDLVPTDEEWLTHLTKCVAPVIDDGLGVLAYRYVYGERATIDIFASADVSPQARQGLDSYRQALAEPDHPLHAAYCRAVEVYRQDRGQALLLSELQRGAIPREVGDLGEDAVGDVLYLRADAVDGTGATVFAAALPNVPRVSVAERDLLHRLGAHIKTAARLRRASSTVATGVLDPVGRVLHAEGDATEALDVLSACAKRIDEARASGSGRHAAALEAWEGLIDGRWSLVEKIDTDGKRLLVVHENPVGLRDPRGLTPMERSVVGLAVQGHGDKLIAYHLGLATGTVSSHLTRAMAKLSVKNRVELIRLLAGRLGQSGTS